MKNILLFGLAILVLVSLFADGGLEVSPTVSPNLQFKPALEFSPNVSYAPDNSTTHIDTNIEQQTVIEHQTVIVQTGPTGGSSNGVTVADPPVGYWCSPAPGEIIVNGPDAKGACTVQDAAGNRFFLNAVGSRWPLSSPAGQLQPQASDLSLDQLRAAFLRNGGELPFGWEWWTPYGQETWLKDQAATWK